VQLRLGGQVSVAMRKSPVVTARGGIEPPTFRFSGWGENRSEMYVLVKLDELDRSCGVRVRSLNGVADNERMKTNRCDAVAIELGGLQCSWSKPQDSDSGVNSSIDRASSYPAILR
jgi:hypothetical protein